LVAVTILDFQVRTAQLSPESYVVSVEGELDLHTAPELEQALGTILVRGGRNVVVDLVDLVFIDSTALATLVRAQPRFRSKGGRLLLVTEDRRILRTLQITGLDRVFDIEPRLGKAVELVLRDVREPAAISGGEAA
jgi:anti-sigma B factor antagonist